MTLATQSEFFSDAAAPVEDSSVRDELIAVVEREWANHPRSLQSAIGPSEIGVECTRQLAAKVAGAQRVNPGGDILPAYIGTATHAKLEEAFIADNAALVAAGKPARWVTEFRVEVAPGLSGSCDLYDSWNGGRVIDHKVVGATSFREYVKSGPSEQYQTQASAYGLGFTRAGYPVREVGIWFIPKAGYLRKSYLWTAPFDPALAEAAVDRLNKVRVAVDVIGAAADFAQLDRVPAKPGKSCRFCSFFSAKPVPGVWSCPGA